MTARSVSSSSALTHSSCTHQVANRPPLQPAGGHDPIEGSLAGDAVEAATTNQHLELDPRIRSAWIMQLRRIEVGEPNLYPFLRVGCVSETEAISVADVPNGSRELHSRTRKRTLTRVSAGLVANHAEKEG